MKEKKQKGFTLIELVFVIVLLALISSVAVPTAGNLLGINMNTASTQVAGYLRTGYEQAVMRQERIRIRFDLERNTYWAETYEPKGGIPLLNAETKIDEAIKAFEDRYEDSNLTPEEELEAEQEQYKRVDKGSLKTTSLPRGVKFKGIYVASEGKTIDSGAPWVEFRPGGFAPKTIVYLTNDSGKVFSVVLQPIGGLSQVQPGEVRPDEA